ncbi:MAG: hypothetical protein R3C03_22000 [Pirellulaceae bacterium]
MSDRIQYCFSQSSAWFLILIGVTGYEFFAKSSSQIAGDGKVNTETLDNIANTTSVVPDIDPSETDDDEPQPQSNQIIVAAGAKANNNSSCESPVSNQTLCQNFTDLANLNVFCRHSTMDPSC